MGWEAAAVGGQMVRLFKLREELFRGREVEADAMRFVPDTRQVEEIDDTAPVTVVADWAAGYYHADGVFPCIQVQAGRWHPLVPGARFVLATANEDAQESGVTIEMEWTSADGVIVTGDVYFPWGPDVTAGDQDIGILWDDARLRWCAALMECG